MTADGEGEQLAFAGLPGARRGGRRGPAAAGAAPAADLPVARVVVDVQPAHLDRVFEYEVPAALAADAQPGTRVKVRFAGRDVDAFVVARSATAEHRGALTPLRRVVSAEPVLTPQVLRLARAVADHYAGTLPDVLRLAVPPRHARTEGESGAEGQRGAEGATIAGARPSAEVQAGPGAAPGPSDGWRDYRGGGALLARLAAGESPRAVWTALPGADGGWADGLAQAAAATALSGRGSIIVVPDAVDVDAVAAALERAGVARWRPGGPPGGYVRLVAEDGPAPRYRAYLAALRGQARVVVGNRAAAFAPVAPLGLLACWDDGDDLHAEPRAPYPHARTVLTLRAELEGAAVVLAAYARSAQAQLLVETGWARALVADRATVRRRVPRVHALTSAELAREGAGAAARVPGQAWRVARDGLERGAVLVQVPRAGYVPVVACAACRTPARCAVCQGPLALPGPQGPARCTVCGALATGWHCPQCPSTSLRAVRVGSQRTAEELGRGFPGARVVVSGAAGRPDTRGWRTGVLVVATPGAEPAAPGGYAAALLLDAGAATARAGLRVSEEALRRWVGAAALVRPADEGGVVALVGDAAPGPTQALVRWDVAGFAERELAERRELGLPPAVASALLSGPRHAVESLLHRAELPPGTDVFGPVVAADDGPPSAGPPAQAAVEGLLPPADEHVRALLRARRADGRALGAALAAAQAVRSVHKERGTVRVQVDAEEAW